MTPLSFLICNVCHGLGVEASLRCRTCDGKGIVVWFHGRLLFFGRSFDRTSFLLNRFRSVIRNIIHGSLFLLAIAGLLALAWFVSNMDIAYLHWREWGQLFFQDDVRILFFWISLLGDGFLWFRFSEETRSIQVVQRRRYGEGGDEEEGTLGEPKTIEEALHIPKHRWLDIAATFTHEATRACFQTWKLAAKVRHAEVLPLHLLAVLPSFLKPRIIFGRLGLSGKDLGSRIQALLKRQQWSQGNAPPVPSLLFLHLPFFAYREAYETKQEKVDLPELLVGTTCEENPVQDIFDDCAVTGEKLRNVAAWITVQKLLSRRASRFRKVARRKPKGSMDRAMTAIATPFLDRVGQDLTLLARGGYLTPAVGRDGEIEEIFRIMEGGRQSVLLVGSPGVGKTTIAEGIAQRILEEDVPRPLIDKRLVSLSVPALVAGASAPGELEQRLQTIMVEIMRAGNIILFIDNVQNLVGVTTEGGETMDLSQVVADVLEKRIFIAIAATTPNDYARYLERNAALSLAFQKVDIREMAPEKAILVLEAKVGYLEYKNGVYFSYDALAKAADLSHHYLHDRFLPDKAIKVIEEVAVYVRKKRGKNAIVSGEDVASIIAEKTNIPVTQVTETEREKLLNIGERIHARVIGQDEAVKVVASALKRARAELRDQKRPIANFLFLGPTGVGKTELAKTVAEVYFGNENNMIRLDMSEYQERSSMNRLIGASIGFEGGGEGGYLTEAVRKQPFALVLFDELEKAHPDILNLFLQMMDDGRLTDTAGRTIDFTNTIIIGTSNAGTQFIQDETKKGTSVEEIREHLLNQELRTHFRPEFLNRFDAVVVFRPLEFLEIVQITKLFLKKVGKRLEEKGITFQASDAAVEELAKVGFDPLFGARPLRRAIQERVDDALATALLQGKIGRRDVAILEPGGAIRIEKAEKL